MIITCDAMNVFVILLRNRKQKTKNKTKNCSAIEWHVLDMAWLGWFSIPSCARKLIDFYHCCCCSMLFRRYEYVWVKLLTQNCGCNWHFFVFLFVCLFVYIYTCYYLVDLFIFTELHSICSVNKLFFPILIF